MYEIWIKRQGERQYLPWVWCFEETDAQAFASTLRAQGVQTRVIYNPTCEMPGWLPPKQMR